MSINLLKEYFVEHPEPIIGAKTIQLVIIREILDYTVLRTEETRELNTVVTPLSITDGTDTRRVAFLATKQKAVESREMERMLRTASEAVGLNYKECYLKDNLCLCCPRCALFGGTNTEGGTEKTANIKHRIEYGTAFSLLPFEEIETSFVFNAITDNTQKTGQALGTRYVVRPATVFPSIITLKSVTEIELILTVKTLLAAKSYGAETRIGGDVRNTIVGITAGWEEIITPLELTLELYEQRDDLSGDTIQSILEKYKTYSGNPQQVNILTPEEVDNTVHQIANTELTKDLISKAYNDVLKYRELQKG
ncbi:MAG: type I-D CRISPR-associated protein Cas7/Csc2 [Clostridia bacterium]|nr:type I-D CRISPR-associated protein Cas7/Csc2 [Clostridia bacterium]